MHRDPGDTAPESYYPAVLWLKLGKAHRNAREEDATEASRAARHLPQRLC
jgi:hypothetical protein